MWKEHLEKIFLEFHLFYLFINKFERISYSSFRWFSGCIMAAENLPVQREIENES